MINLFDDKYIDTIIGSIFIAGLIMLTYGIIGAVKAGSLNNECLIRGYPKSKLTFTFEGYCIKRVDQTDVVVPFKDIK